MLAFASPAARLLLGALLAGVVSLAARRAGALDRSGAVAATAAGAAAVAAGWSWAALLIAYFVATSALSRVGAAIKAERTGDVVAKGGARDWWQVGANGGVFTLAALASAVAGPSWTWSALAAGSLAAAAADSWGTEVGTLAGRPPRSILSLRRVPPGTSGGVTLQGSLATVAGAVFIGGLAWAFGWDGRVALAAAAGGVAGAFTDSLVGATLQVRRRCPRCGIATERAIHRCGAPTAITGGLAWLDNDAVNLACALTGGLLAVLFAR
jgi:uncharacterized protein (TIGR00297 family)